MKEILLITNYFPPEIGAASIRIFNLAYGLHKKQYKVSVITPLPNYPKGKIFQGYKGKFKQTSVENNITVHRLWIFASNSKSKISRFFAMISYSFCLIWFFIWNKIPRTVIVQSPPLLVAFTSILFLRFKKRKLILNISDLWPIAGLELGVFKKNLNYKLLEKIERFNYKKADLVLGQSEEILTHIKSIYPKKETFLYRNYPNFEPPKIEYNTPDSKIKMVYAGLLGVAQGIYRLCQELDYSKIEFHIYGSGAEQRAIEFFLTHNSHLPIVYHGELKRESLHKELLMYDVAIIPLLNRVYGSVPSKIFEHAHLGLPMIYFGGGEGEGIIEQNKLGWVAKAGDYNDLNKVISRLKKETLNMELKQKIKTSAVKIFDFENQLNEVVRII